MPWLYDKYFSGFGLCLEADNLIFSKKSPYQRIKIFQTKKFGRVLTLGDGSVQLTEKDEFIYHEMIAHVPMLSLGQVKKVLIIGDGDGGILREVLKHPVGKVYLVEIDKDVIDICQKYLPRVSGGAFKDKRAEIIIGDGAQIIKNFKNTFDLVIVGSPDPVGEGRKLFSKKFYRDIYNALNKNGMMVCQSGPIIAWPDTLYGKINSRLRKIFPISLFYLSFIPTYPGTLWTFCAASKKINPAKINLKKIRQKYDALKLKTKYYNPEVHLSSFVLPNFLKKYQI